MVPGRPDKLAEPDPNPRSCATDGSQRQEWGHQGCLGHFGRSEGPLSGTGGHPEVFPQLQCCGPSSGEFY